MDRINPEDLKESLIVIALDNLASLYEIALEDAKNMPEEEVEYIKFIISYSRQLIQEYKKPTTIQRPKWKTE